MMSASSDDFTCGINGLTSGVRGCPYSAYKYVKAESIVKVYSESRTNEISCGINGLQTVKAEPMISPVASMALLAE